MYIYVTNNNYIDALLRNGWVLNCTRCTSIYKSITPPNQFSTTTHHFVARRCGQETRVIPRLLQLRTHWLKSEKESVRLEEAGITKEVSCTCTFEFIVH